AVEDLFDAEPGVGGVAIAVVQEDPNGLSFPFGHVPAALLKGVGSGGEGLAQDRTGFGVDQGDIIEAAVVLGSVMPADREGNGVRLDRDISGLDLTDTGFTEPEGGEVRGNLAGGAVTFKHGPGRPLCGSGKNERLKT